MMREIKYFGRYTDPAVYTAGFSLYGAGMTTRGLTIEERLLRRLVVTPSGCWEHQGPRDHKGYCEIQIEGKRHRAHRIAFKLWVSPDIDGLVIRHKCDNKPCCNPDHLVSGSVADNNRDTTERGSFNHPKGSKHHRTSLSEEDVIRIRSESASGGYGTNARLAREYGIAPNTLSAIVHRRTWAHV